MEPGSRWKNIKRLVALGVNKDALPHDFAKTSFDHGAFFYWFRITHRLSRCLHRTAEFAQGNLEQHLAPIGRNSSGINMECTAESGHKGWHKCISTCGQSPPIGLTLAAISSSLGEHFSPASQDPLRRPCLLSSALHSAHSGR